MPGVARLGDIVGPGGVIAAPVIPSITVDGRPVAHIGSVVTPHFCCGMKGCPPTHCMSAVVMGDPHVTVNGIPIAYKGAMTTCLHSISTGSSTVTVGGLGMLGSAASLGAKAL